LICVALFEIIIAVIAATGMGLNVLATSNGVADVKLVNTSVVVGQYYAHVSMEIDGYQFSGSFENVTTRDNEFYSYKKAYNDNCGTGMPSAGSSRSCKVRYAVWQWTRAYTALGTIAMIIIFITGVALLFLTCCGGLCSWCCGSLCNMLCCGRNKDKNKEDNQCCWWSLCSCTIELWLLILNLLVFILFAFSWGIILGLKFNNDLKSILATEANQALNNRKSIETYDFTFDTIKVGKSLWPLAVSSLLALLVSFYLLLMVCFTCCRNCDNCENCDNMMRFNYNTKQHNNNTYQQTNKTQKSRTKVSKVDKVSKVEMACDDVQV